MPFTKTNKTNEAGTEKFKKKPIRMGKPLWGLYRDGLTQGAISWFLDCREQFRLRFEEGWTAKRTSMPLEFGSAFHEALAVVQNVRKRVSSPQTALNSYLGKRVKELKLSAQDKADLELTIAQVGVVLDAYLKFWKKEDDKRDWLAREEIFNYSYRFQIGDKNSSTKAFIPLRGRWDGLFVPKEKPALWLHETKTKGRIDDEGIRACLPFDLQTMLYAFTAMEKYGEIKELSHIVDRYPLGGTLYDVVRQPQLKRGVQESMKDFLDRIKADISNRPRWYFYRWEVRLQQRDLDNWEKNFLIPVLRDICNWYHQREDHHFMNPTRLFNRFGSRSDYFDAITAGNFYGLYRRKEVYQELRD
jgi:hypothetical protein